MTYHYHTNNLYNVRALTDENGDVIERYQYSAYGEPAILDDASNERQRSAVGNAYMFQGRRMDEEIGLYYYRNRYYSAVLGRFVTTDPKGYVDGYNLYQYAGSYPTGARDPLGTASIEAPEWDCTPMTEDGMKCNIFWESTKTGWVNALTVAWSI